ncbi:DUF6603 domain-containing protein [Burkholderia ubonensis]|uniref:DUF6603 domain-containing protein n=1 Tax=Burkholderia ubonensis TaxID=101571 RepID=UPI00075960B2|nr:DUF6603 domain-containing protein [Burkholderia ubonensis]KVZ49470.1 hypothetical protein WL19_15810 [Burkholderia ubonensis]
MSTITTDVATLVATLQQAILGDDSLPFTGKLIGSTDLDTLLAQYFAGGTVTLAHASVTPSTDGESAVATGTVQYGAVQCAVTLLLTPNEQDIALALTLTPPAGWTLPQAFPGALLAPLDSLAFADGGIVICSGPYVEPSQKLTLQRGMSLVASVDLAASYPALAVLVGNTPVPLHGTVSDANLPLLSLITDPVPATLGGVKLAQLSITFAYVNVAEAHETPAAAASASLQANITLADKIGGTITATLPGGTSLLSIDTSFTQVNLGDFELLAPFLGNANPLACLPDELATAFTKSASHFQLSALSFTFDTSALRFASVRLAVTIDLQGFAPFQALPGISIDDIVFSWTIEPAASPVRIIYSAQADLTVKNCPISVGFQTRPAGSYAVVVAQAPNAKLKVSDLVDAFLPGLDLPELDVEDFSMTLLPRDSTYQLTATIDGSWTALQSADIELATVSIDALYNAAAKPALSGSVTGTFSLAVPAGGGAYSTQAGRAQDTNPPTQIDLILSATRPAGSQGWLLLGQTGQDQLVPIGDLIAALAQKFGVASDVPTPLQGLTIENLGMQLDTTTEKFMFGCQLNVDIENEAIQVLVEATVSNTGNGYDIEFGGSILVSNLEFDLKFAKKTDPGGSSNVLLGEFQAHGNAGSVDLKQLVGSILPGVAADLPDGLAIDVNDAMLALVQGGAPPKKFVFAMDLALEFPLSTLPIIGKAVPADAKAGIKNLKLVIASAALSADEVALIDGVAATPVLPTPAPNSTGDAVPKGFSMAAELELGPLTMLLTSPSTQQRTPNLDNAARRPAVLASLPVAAAGDTPPVTWVNVQKTFGPVSIQKVGFSYHDSNVYVMANLALEVGGLEIDLIGIGMHSPIKNPSVQFEIEGLAASYVEGPVSIMGGLIGTLEPVNFTGALSVRVPEFALAALAGYDQLTDGQPSFFLYGVLDAPLGGLPAFFVTGIAAGVGFNRSLVVPDVSGVAAFPLVQWAQGSGAPPMDPTKPIGDQVMAALTQLTQAGVVAPVVGDYWLAAGVQFTSFEIVNSFALLTLSVGTDVEIAVLGLSTATLPPAEPVPVAEVQLELELSFSFDKGLLAVAGQLTNNSYVFTRECRLTGGFAFYLWIKGEHAGETVLTLGGYNPNFTVPDYYPQVPRLGLAWRVVPELSVNGSLYFAVTPHVTMAGGKLSAVWNSGPISAWFTYWADFLMTFKPFHYYVDGGIDLGASFTVDMWLFSVSVTIHVGVDLALWGPPFAGRARVDLSIISFTISFNDQAQRTDTGIPWNSFVSDLLPQQPSAQTAPRARRRGRMLPAPAQRDADAPAAVVQINVTSGLVKALAPTADGPCYLINAENFQCAVLTVIPSKSVIFEKDPLRPDFVNLDWAPDSQQPSDGNGTPIPVNQGFGVGPVQIAPQDFQPTLTLQLSADEDSELLAIRRLSNAPKALWQIPDFDPNHHVPTADPHTALTETSITNTLAGVTLVPHDDRPDYLRPVPLESLLYTLDDNVRPFAWSPGIAPTQDPFTNQTVDSTITAPVVSAVRAQLLGALAEQQVSVETSLDVASLAHPANNDIEAAPRLRLLGEQPAHA